jgi:hypothetical protein
MEPGKPAIFAVEKDPGLVPSDSKPMLWRAKTNMPSLELEKGAVDFAAVWGSSLEVECVTARCEALSRQGRPEPH